MFTGIIEELGTIRSVRSQQIGASLTVAAEMVSVGLKQGGSVAVNGVCLTVTGSTAGTFSCDLSAETLRRSTLGRLREGMAVNLERPLAVGDRLDGHFVLGHVDGTGTLASKSASGEGCLMAFSCPPEIQRYLVQKGSIAVDGISLTIAGLEEDAFTVAIIPHTLKVTNLKGLRLGDAVNLEADILGKYVGLFVRPEAGRETSSKVTLKHLEDGGF